MDINPIETEAESIEFIETINTKNSNLEKEEKALKLTQEEEWIKSEELYKELEIKERAIEEITEDIINNKDGKIGNMTENAIKEVWHDITAPRLRKEIALLNEILKNKGYTVEEITTAIFASQNKENNSEK